MAGQGRQTSNTSSAAPGSVAILSTSMPTRGYRKIEEAAIDRAIFEGDALQSDRKYLIACVRNRHLGSRSA